MSKKDALAIIFIDEIDFIGPGDSLKKVTQVDRHMVCQWGRETETGEQVFNYDQNMQQFIGNGNLNKKCSVDKKIYLLMTK